MTRFFVEPEEMQPEFLVLTGENAKHAKVLRLKNGEEVLVCDGQGRECLCVVSDVSEGQIGLVVKHRKESETEAPVRVSVYIPENLLQAEYYLQDHIDFILINFLMCCARSVS